MTAMAGGDAPSRSSAGRDRELDYGCAANNIGRVGVAKEYMCSAGGSAY